MAWKREGEGWEAELATAVSLVGEGVIRVERANVSELDGALLVLVSG
jgi:hypothetical protein